MFRVILYSNIVFLLVFFSPIYGANFSITADGDAHIQEDKGVLVINKNIVINYMDNIIKTNSLVVNFHNLDNVSDNLKKQSFINFKTIEATNPFVFYTSKQGVLKGSRYFFNVAKNIMIVTSTSKYITYEDKTVMMYAKQRLEYQVDKHLGVLRGSPKIILKDSNSVIYSNLITAQLDENNHTLLHMEAFDKVYIILANKSRIRGNYAYYDAKKNSISVEDNVSLNNDSGILKACRIIIDVLTGDSEVIPCKNQENFNTKVTVE
jgi:lipopolysaccharide export system protein LptA